MRRPWLLALILVGSWACTSSTGGGTEAETPPATQPEAKPAAQPDPAGERTDVQRSPDDALDALALRCAGTELHAELSALPD